MPRSTLTVGLDCETWLSRRGRTAPPLVCTTLSARGEALELVRGLLPRRDVRETPSGFLLGREASREAWPKLLASGATLVGHRIFYDLAVLVEHAGCLDAVFAAIDDGRIADTLLREKLWAIAHGRIDYDPEAKVKDGHYSLASLVKKHAHVDIAAEKGVKPGKGVDVTEEWVEEKQACGCGLPVWYGEGAPPVDCPEGRCDGYGLTGPWRFRYRQLWRVPLDAWPVRAVDYAVEDAEWADIVYELQSATEAPYDARTPLLYPEGDFVDEQNQIAGAWAMRLHALWGPRCDPDAVEHTVGEWSELADKCIAVGQAAGFVRANEKEDRSKMKARIAAAYTAKGEEVPRNDPTETMLNKALEMRAEVESMRAAGITKPAKLTAAWKRARATDDPFATFLAEADELEAGSIKYDRDTLAASGDPDLEAYAEGTLYRSYMSKFAKILRFGAEGPITSSPNYLVSTGRSAVADPPMQQPPKKGGYREAHVPRRGFMYASGDYDTIELAAQAQNLREMGFGDTLANKINSGLDLHTDLACEELELDYDTAKRLVKSGDPLAVAARGRAKAANFSFWGGAGVASTVTTYGVETFSPSGDYDEAHARAEALRASWFKKNPEAKPYLSMINDLLRSGGGSFVCTHPMSGRLRMVDRYTVGANGYFQGRVADGAKLGVYRLARECYTDRLSPLWGSRPWLLLHDEVLAEVPRSRAQEAVERMVRVLMDAMSALIPDVRVNVDPILARRWYKSADELRTEEGVLLPWEPWRNGEWRPWAGSRREWVAVEQEPGAVFVWDGVRSHHFEHLDPTVARHRAECFILDEEPLA